MRQPPINQVAKSYLKSRRYGRSRFRAIMRLLKERKVPNCAFDYQTTLFALTYRPLIRK